MGLLTFALNVTLDGCNDHREMIADDELHDFFTRLMGAAGAMLFGRVTYELMESAWPAVARDEHAPRAMREWAVDLEAKPKYVASRARHDFPWKNTTRLEGELRPAIEQLKAATPPGVFSLSCLTACCKSPSTRKVLSQGKSRREADTTYFGLASSLTAHSRIARGAFSSRATAGQALSMSS